MNSTPLLFFRKHHKIIFYCSWFLLNLLQAASTGLFDDEAYYWVYSRFLDWGYFDHPPMIALLIKLGYAISPNEFGVRLIVSLLGTATLWIIEKLISYRDNRLFYAIVLSMAVLQLGGMIAVPDVPLIFFTALFFLCYKKFISTYSFKNALFLGIAMALMLYSKYHSILIIFFTIISNIKLLAKPKSYVAAIVAIVLFAPHVYWQYQHRFPSIQYHLFERGASSYSIKFTLEYLGAQLLYPGPFAGFIILWAAFKRQPADYAEKALKYSMVGLYLIFFLATFRGRVEGNWTFTAFIGLIVLSHMYLFSNERLKKWVYRFAIITILFVLFLRIYLIANIFPRLRLKNDEFHYNKEWVESIRIKSGGLPVLFVDSYQDASKYWFYSGIPTYSLNTVLYRRNNFNLWKMEDSLLNKKMFKVYTDTKRMNDDDSVKTLKGVYYCGLIERYFSYSRIQISSKNISGTSRQPIGVKLAIKADDETLNRIIHPYDSCHIWAAVYYSDNEKPLLFPTNVTLGMIRSKQQDINSSMTIDMDRGNYILRFGISSCFENRPSLNSSVIKLRLE